MVRRASQLISVQDMSLIVFALSLSYKSSLLLHKVGYCDLIAPLSAIRFAIMPHNSFHVRSGYWNLEPLTCAPSMGKSIGTRGSCMSFDTCESRILMHSVPFPSLGILGADAFMMLYLIVLLPFRWNLICEIFQFQFFQLFFLLLLFYLLYI